ncbi:L-2,3-butanediol dehydrogenase [Mycena indigotica]|uniref:L-2,3-butanediol dehydrogenase n=1 Tax=Mycena indigotica TaxID=2126181 RepID=A0A8H6VV02_9AGAR|nr:L-2,3-butanediol dehydrogenase [Mycena indigotica]KAF7289254.1 L-2,3-butanediol dehydrogenase [Mycena indigotica]
MSPTSTSTGVALVTGAAQGIGKSIALRLASDGFDVALNDIPSKKDELEAVMAEVLKTRHGIRASVVVGDVSSEESVSEMVQSVVAALGGLDVMVANAGICKARASFLDVSAAEWDHTFSINTRGTFLCYKYAAKQMISQGRGGRIIGACSGAGKQGYIALPDYSSSKFAIRGLTQAVAQELGKHGITVNAYAPGAVITPMTQQFPEMAGVPADDFFAAQAKMNATGVNVTPGDIASLVSFFASKESGFMTGQTLSADGGRYFD